MKDYQLMLYVTGETPHSSRAIENLKRICNEQGLYDEFEIRIIDILREPQLAEEDKIIATPTLVKRFPAPLRKVIGDFSEVDKVLLGLDLVARNKEVPA